MLEMPLAGDLMPEIFHSDEGLVHLLCVPRQPAGEGLPISGLPSKSCYDNIWVNRLSRRLKYEILYL